MAVTYQIVGHVYTATLALNSSSKTTWYLPLFNYSGSVYVSQIYSSGEMSGSIVWSNITASNAAGGLGGFSPNYITSNCVDTMSLQYNPAGSWWGLQFTNVDLTSYNLSVMYVGLGGPSNGSLTLTQDDPS